MISETTCFWDHRISAQWFMQALAADSFVLPPLGEPLTSILAKVDTSRFSELSVPMVEGFSLPGAKSPLLNVLQRFPLLGEDLFFEGGRTMPIGNPRHHTYGCVHWLEYGRNSAARGVMREREVLQYLGLHALHRERLAPPPPPAFSFPL